MDLTKRLQSLVPGWGVLQGLGVTDIRWFIALVTVLVAGIVTKVIFRSRRRKNLERLPVQKQLQCRQAIETLEKKVNEDDAVSAEKQAEIRLLSFNDLQKNLRTKQLEPTKVLLAYQVKALEVHKNTNCLVEPIWEAQPQALELSEDKTDLPLFGIPVSLKDCYGLRGYDSTVGLAQWVEKPFQEDCVIVKVLKQQGAIPFVKTNVPQLMVSIETSNPIFGKTTNPHNKEFSSGGSSGGEGALIAGGGSVLGFGSDIAGSIRIPSAFCGLYGFKPTTGRLSDKGMFPLWEGQTVIKAAYGPMAREVDGLVVAMKALLTPLMFQLDPTVPPLPFNEQVLNERRQLKIGYYTYDGFFHAVPACQRAVQEAVQQLRNLGHEVIEWDFSKFGRRIIESYCGTVFGDGGKEVLKHLEGNTVDPVLKLYKMYWSLNTTLKKIVSRLLSLVYPNMAGMLRESCEKGSTSAWWKVVADDQALRKVVMEDWMSKGLDAVVLPGFACPALPHGLASQCGGVLSYTAAYNFLQYPTGSLPVTKVTRADVEKVMDYPTPDFVHKMIKEAQHGTEGLPVGVQVAALPWQDELCLRVMKELETALKQQ